MIETTKRIIIARDQKKGAPLMAALEPYGILSYAVPVTETVYDISKTIPGELNEYNHIAFTSANAVTAFSKILNKVGVKLNSKLKVCAVGLATSAAVKRSFREPDLVSEESNAESLARSMIENVENPEDLKVLWPCAADALPGFDKILSGAGAEVTRFECYRTEARATREIKSELQKIAQWDLVFFAAPSAVRAFSEAWQDRSEFMVVAIGPTTRNALFEAGYKNIITSKGTTVEKCAGAIVDALKIRVWS